MRRVVTDVVARVRAEFHPDDLYYSFEVLDIYSWAEHLRIARASTQGEHTGSAHRSLRALYSSAMRL